MALQFYTVGYTDPITLMAGYIELLFLKPYCPVMVVGRCVYFISFEIPVGH